MPNEQRQPAVAGQSLVLLLEDAPRHFDVAGRALESARARLDRDELVSLDLLFLPPGTLVCLLHLSARAIEGGLRELLREEAVAAHFSVLDTVGFSPAEIVRSVVGREQRLVIQESGVVDLGPSWSRLRQYVMGGLREPSPSELTLVLHYPSGDAFLKRWGRARGLFIESEATLPVGQRCRLRLSTGTRQGPLELEGRVVHAVDQQAARLTQEPAGFGVGFVLPPEERDAFDSFLIALERGTPWPDRSGRRHERFPIQLRIVYDYEGEARREHSDNLSRGGLFIHSFDPPAIGAVLELELYAPGRKDALQIQARVMHAVSVEEAAVRGVRSGAGVQFIGSGDSVRDAVESFLSGVETPVSRRALVVDDDKFFRSIIGNLLRLAGFDVREASDGEGALRLLTDELLQLDLLLLDLYMPGMTGVELVDRIRRVGRERDLAVVLLTGAELSQAEAEGLERLGADDVLSKAMPPEKLLERIEAVLAKRA